MTQLAMAHQKYGDMYVQCLAGGGALSSGKGSNLRVWEDDQNVRAFPPCLAVVDESGLISTRKNENEYNPTDLTLFLQADLIRIDLIYPDDVNVVGHGELADLIKRKKIEDWTKREVPSKAPMQKENL